MSRCMFCKRDVKTYNVTFENGTVILKNLIVDLLGKSQDLIDNNRNMCASCIYLIDNMLAMKRCFERLLGQDDSQQAFAANFSTFMSIYETFLHNLRSTKYTTTEIIQNPSPHSNFDSNTRRITQLEPFSKRIQEEDNDNLNESDLLEPMYSEPYRSKTIKRNLRSDTPVADKEIEKAFSNKISRPKSTSILGRSAKIPKSVLYRSASVPKFQQLIDPLDRFMCIQGCSAIFYDLDALTKHKVEYHKLLAKYWCYECHRRKFTSEQDLNAHKALTHKVVLSHCLLCSEVLSSMLELQYHLLQHKKRSVQCLYCDKSFLNETTYRLHRQESHKSTKFSDIKQKYNIIQTKIKLKEEQVLTPLLKPGEIIIKELNIRKESNHNNNLAKLQGNVTASQSVALEQNQKTRIIKNGSVTSSECLSEEDFMGFEESSRSSRKRKRNSHNTKTKNYKLRVSTSPAVE